MKNWTIALVVVIMCSVLYAQEISPVQQHHNQLLVKENLNKFLDGEHQLVTLPFANCAKEKWLGSLYLLEQQFSFYTEVGGLVCHQTGQLLNEAGKGNLALQTHVWQNATRGTAVVTCNTCGFRDCYPCTASGPENCVVFRFTECGSSGCKISWSQSHFSADHTWRKLNRRGDETTWNLQTNIVFHLNKVGIEVDGNFAKICPQAEKMPFSVLSCSNQIYPTLRQHVLQNEYKAALLAFVKAEKDALLPIFLGDLVYDLPDLGDCCEHAKK